MWKRRDVISLLRSQPTFLFGKSARKQHSADHRKERGDSKKTRDLETLKLKAEHVGFPGGAVVENLPANAGDMGSSPGLGRSHMPRSN